jgi:hypothetical protein
MTRPGPAEGARMSEQDQLAAAVKLAREAANGWACYAKRRREHEEITRIHRALDEIELAAPSPMSDQG